MTARRLYLSAQTPQNGTRKIPKTKMRLVKSPVNVGICAAGRPTSWRRRGRKANTWAMPSASIVETIPYTTRSERHPWAGREADTGAGAAGSVAGTPGVVRGAAGSWVTGGVYRRDGSRRGTIPG